MQGKLPMHLSPRCGARSKRTGEPCRSAAMKNGRCRMHGGKSSGAPKGNQNALKHGNYTAAAQAALREKKREIRRILDIERRKFRELPEEWADRAFFAWLGQRCATAIPRIAFDNEEKPFEKMRTRGGLTRNKWMFGSDISLDNNAAEARTAHGSP
jgi:hypothetical protein